MINIDFTNIDNAKIIGRTLPFWVRGRKASLLLQALLHPIISVHRSFQAWALERYIECNITAQKMSIEWFLKHKLKSHLYNPEDNFTVTQDPSEIEDPSYAFSKNETYVLAPAIIDTVNYSHDDYERDIRNIMSKYMINFNKIKVLVAEI